MVETDKYQGKIAKGLTVRTNDPEHPAASLQLEADIRTWIDVLPNWAGNVLAELGKGGEQVLYLKGKGEEPYDVIGATTDSRWVSAGVEKINPADPDAMRGEFRVRLRAAPEAPVGPLQGKISVTTTNPKQRYLHIPLAGQVQGPINFLPATLVLYSDETGRPPRLSGTIVLQARPGAPPFQVEEVRADDARLQVDPLSAGSSLVWRLGATWNSPGDKGVHAGTVRIRTSNAEMRDIEVPFQVRIE